MSARKLWILVACEESQAITKEFRKLGHHAFSCDLQDCSGGHPEWYLKCDCLWLKGLPPLKPTNIVSKGEYITFPSGRKMPKWYKEIGDLPIRERGKLRSKTFPGIAKAIAEQWSEYLTKGGEDDEG